MAIWDKHLNRWRDAIKKAKASMGDEVLKVEDIGVMLEPFGLELVKMPDGWNWKIVLKKSDAINAALFAALSGTTPKEPEDTTSQTEGVANTGLSILATLTPSTESGDTEDVLCDHEWQRGRLKSGPVKTCNKCLVLHEIDEAEFVNLR